MSDTNISEVTDLPLDDIVRDMRRAVQVAAKELAIDSASSEFGLSESRFVIPKAKVTARIELTVSKNEVRGIFRRNRSSEQATAMSTLEFEMVAIPNEPD